MRARTCSNSCSYSVNKATCNLRVAPRHVVCRAESTSRQEAEQQSIECVGEGQNVTCSVEDATVSTNGEEKVKVSAVDGGDMGATDQWFTEALSLALLVSPFFFWGTSMVFMKVRIQCLLRFALHNACLDPCCLDAQPGIRIHTLCLSHCNTPYSRIPLFSDPNPDI